MKIAISGAHGTGKSTLMNALKLDSNFSNFSLITEIVRSLALRGIKINKGADYKSQMIILEEHFRNTLNHKDSFITDRCSLDAFAYATWDYLNGEYSLQEYFKLEEIFLKTINSYDKIFYIKPEFGLVDDGFRNTESDYQADIHNIFCKLIEKYNIKVINLTGSVESRMNEITLHI